MSLDLTGKLSLPFYRLDVATASIVDVFLSPNYNYTFVHLGEQVDGTVSDTTNATISLRDYVVMMQKADTMAADKVAGAKAIINPNGHCRISGDDIRETSASDPIRKVQLQAVNHSAKIQIMAFPRRLP